MYHRSRDNIAPQDEQNMRLLRQRYKTRALLGDLCISHGRNSSHTRLVCAPAQKLETTEAPGSYRQDFST